MSRKPESQFTTLLYQLAFAVFVIAAMLLSQRGALASLFQGSIAVATTITCSFTCLLLIRGVADLVRQLIYYQREVTEVRRYRTCVENGSDFLMVVSVDSMVGRTVLHVQKLLRSLKPQPTLAIVETVMADLQLQERRRLEGCQRTKNLLGMTAAAGGIFATGLALFASSITYGQIGRTVVLGGISSCVLTVVLASMSFILFSYFYLATSGFQRRFLAEIRELTTSHIIPQLEAEQEEGRFEMRLDGFHRQFTEIATTLESLSSDQAINADSGSEVNSQLQTLLAENAAASRQVQQLLKQVVTSSKALSDKALSDKARRSSEGE